MIKEEMQTRWRFRDQTSEFKAVDFSKQATELGLPQLVAKLLWLRGVTGKKASEQFLHPKLTNLHDPTLMPGLEAAASRLRQAIVDHQPIVIFGDYDVDGITSSSILWHVLKTAGADVQTYVPHRIDEGYGLNNEAINKLCNPDDGVKPVIISVDCGITAVEPAKVAKAAGVDLIITDHHEFDPNDLPDAYALVHPRLPGSKYPFGELCGAGVAFKVAWQFAKIFCGSDRVSDTFRSLLIDLLPLAALGTVADIVPMVDENRILTVHGLSHIKNTAIVGLNAMIQEARLVDKNVDAYQVGFVLGPRLNACGRMGHADKAMKLMTDATPQEAAEIAAFLTRENTKRQSTERAIVKEAHQLVKEQGYDQPDQRAIVIAKEGWHQGVVGIVASRMVSTYYRPAIVLTITDGNAQGSARSVDGVCVHTAISQCKEHLTTFGGHAMAAGVRLEADKIDVFRNDFVASVNQVLAEDELTPVIEIDTVCQLAELKMQTVSQLEKLAPFGRNNPGPMFCAYGLTLESSPQVMGKQGKHLRLMLRDGEYCFKAVGFSMGKWIEVLSQGMKVDIAFEPSVNHWQGRSTVELMLKDIHVSSQ